MPIDVLSLPVHHVLVCYPSGQELTVEGHWLGPLWCKRRVRAIALFVWEHAASEQASCVALDPRGVYVSLTTHEVLYQPRFPQYRTHQEGWVQQFLREHPTWPARLEGRLAGVCGTVSGRPEQAVLEI